MEAIQIRRITQAFRTLSLYAPRLAEYVKHDRENIESSRQELAERATKCIRPGQWDDIAREENAIVKTLGEVDNMAGLQICC